MKKLTLFCLLISSLFADGKSLYDQNCASCHGANGQETAVSGKAINGQKASDIELKLIGYKNGSYGGSQKDTMKASVTALSDADIKSIAVFVSTLK